MIGLVGCAQHNRRAHLAALLPKPVAIGRTPHATARAAWREWTAIGASPWVLKVSREGHLLPWRHRPPPCKVPPLPVPSDVATWAATEVQRWAAWGYARRATAEEEANAEWKFTSFVADVKTKPRLVIDFSPQNDHLYDQAFKYEQLPSFISALKQDDHLFSWDITDAFHHIYLAPRERAPLAFRVAGVLYFFLTLPFGLKLAPRALTKVLRPAVAHLRQLGYHVMPYMDDFAATMAQTAPVTEAKATAGRVRVVALLERLGLHVHPTKGATVGTTTPEILGCVLDTRRCLVLLPAHRRKRIVGAAHFLLRATCTDRRWVRTRALQRFCGLAASASLAVPLARFRLRALYSGTVTYRHRSRLPARALQDLFW